MPASPAFNVFISAVSSEAGAARDEIASDLRARGLTVKVQRDFRQEAGTDTLLSLLDHYIRTCDAVVHVAGQRSGAFPAAAAVEAYRHALPADVTTASYTQFEFHLARHHGRRLSIYMPEDAFRPDQEKPSAADEDFASQARHIAWIKDNGLHYETFATTDALCRLVLKEDWPRLATRKRRNLPFASLGPLFKGREGDLAKLHAAFADRATGAAAVVGRALHGLGGVGKTRLAVEYAWAHAAAHSALLFLRADTPERLNAGLAALAGPDILDLPEKDAPTDDIRIPAALGWLEHHPGWLLILDNVDTPEAVRAVSDLLVRLRGGRVLITARVSNLPAAIRKTELGELDPEAAASFLLDRTEGDREPAPDGPAQARALADELGHLALGLEQAGAYIATERISFARYLKLWREKREAVIGWFDRDLMSYDHDTGLAATWLTSVERLAPESRRLLERLSFFAPGPIPTFLLDVPIPPAVDGEPEEEVGTTPLAGLYAYSLAARVAADTPGATPSFSIHRLVQDFARRGMSEARQSQPLAEALRWMNAAFQGTPWDVRSWARLDPLAPHALAVAVSGDEAGALQAMSRLFNQLGMLARAKARWNEAEPLLRRALAISEASYELDHSAVAISLNNLALLLHETNRLAEAEPLMRRALAIAEASYGPDHPTVATRLSNLAMLLQATNWPAEAEPLMRRALAIDEASYGPEHPEVATDLNNLAQLLHETNRLGEAEPLMRRALAISEASYGPDHPNVAVSLNNVAQLLRGTDRLAEAEPLMRRALAIDEASYGPDHPEVATDLNNLALLFKDTNRLGEAEPLMRRALAINEASYGPDHPTTQLCGRNLAVLLDAISAAAGRQQPPGAKRGWLRRLFGRG